MDIQAMDAGNPEPAHFSTQVVPKLLNKWTSRCFDVD